MIEIGRITEEEPEKKKKWTAKYDMDDIEDIARMAEDGMFCM